VRRSDVVAGRTDRGRVARESGAVAERGGSGREGRGERGARRGRTERGREARVAARRAG